MNISQTLKFQELSATAAGTQGTVPDSRKDDAWIKNYLDAKQKRLDDLRKSLHNLIDRPPALDEYERPEQDTSRAVNAAFRVDKPPLSYQKPEKVASGGGWAVVSPEGEIISTWPDRASAERAARPFYKGLMPSSTGATAGAMVKKVHANDIFDDEELDDKGRSEFIEHPKPKVVKLADFLRMGDVRPSSHGQGSAGTGGAGYGGGGGGV